MVSFKYIIEQAKALSWMDAQSVIDIGADRTTR